MNDAILSAIITGAFSVIGIWLQYYLTARRRARRRKIASQPKTAPLSTPAKTPAAGRSHRGVLLATVIYLICAVGSSVGAFINIESIVGTGPVITLAGIALAIVGARAGNRILVAVGVSAPAASLCCLLLIWLLGLHPSRAQVPMSVGIAVYVGLCLVASFAALRLVRVIQASQGPPRQ
jgi:hypothetical protein